MLCQFERGKHDTFVRGSVAFVTGEGSVMYKSLRTRKSDYVQRLRLVKLVVPFVSRPEQLMSLFGKDIIPHNVVHVLGVDARALLRLVLSLAMLRLSLIHI